MQGRFGTRTRQADQSGQQVHALAAPDQHACHEWQQGNADDARGPGEYLQGNRQESGQHQYPERRPWALRRNDLQFGHLGINASQPPQRIEQRANSGKREVPEGVADQCPEYGKDHADRGKTCPFLRARQHHRPQHDLRHDRKDDGFNKAEPAEYGLGSRMTGPTQRLFIQRLEQFHADASCARSRRFKRHRRARARN